MLRTVNLSESAVNSFLMSMHSAGVDVYVVPEKKKVYFVKNFYILTIEIDLGRFIISYQTDGDFNNEQLVRRCLNG